MSVPRTEALRQIMADALAKGEMSVNVARQIGMVIEARAAPPQSSDTEGLRAYLRHKAGCMVEHPVDLADPTCTCGLAAALASRSQSSDTEGLVPASEVRPLIEHRIGLYILAAEKVGMDAESAMAVIGDRDPYLARAAAALASRPSEEGEPR